MNTSNQLVNNCKQCNTVNCFKQHFYCNCHDKALHKNEVVVVTWKDELYNRKDQRFICCEECSIYSGDDAHELEYNAYRSEL